MWPYMNANLHSQNWKRLWFCWCCCGVRVASCAHQKIQTTIICTKWKLKYIIWYVFVCLGYTTTATTTTNECMRLSVWKTRRCESESNSMRNRHTHTPIDVWRWDAMRCDALFSCICVQFFADSKRQWKNEKKKNNNVSFYLPLPLTFNRGFCGQEDSLCRVIIRRTTMFFRASTAKEEHEKNTFFDFDCRHVFFGFGQNASACVIACLHA